MRELMSIANVLACLHAVRLVNVRECCFLIDGGSA
jgi:hypothetical protein